jgi:hypothetical protein
MSSFKSALSAFEATNRKDEESDCSSNNCNRVQIPVKTSRKWTPNASKTVLTSPSPATLPDIINKAIEVSSKLEEGVEAKAATSEDVYVDPSVVEESEEEPSSGHRPALMRSWESQRREKANRDRKPPKRTASTKSEMTLKERMKLFQ